MLDDLKGYIDESILTKDKDDQILLKALKFVKERSDAYDMEESNDLIANKRCIHSIFK